jgi:hypothetical protein
LFIAFLILVMNFSTDLGLGQISQLMFLDFFNLSQLALVLIAVCESVTVRGVSLVPPSHTIRQKPSL